MFVFTIGQCPGEDRMVKGTEGLREVVGVGKEGGLRKVVGVGKGEVLRL